MNEKKLLIHKRKFNITKQQPTPTPISTIKPSKSKKSKSKSSKPKEEVVLYLNEDDLEEVIEVNDSYIAKVKKKRKKIDLKPKPFACHLCESKFAYKGNLNAHIKIHSTTKPFKCKLCPSTFKTSGYLKRHHETVHLGYKKPKKYKCTECDYRCRTNQNLILHVRSLHTEDKPISCKVCDYRSNHLSSMKAHMRKHNNEYFVCDECDDYKTVWKFDLEKHKKRMH